VTYGKFNPRFFPTNITHSYQIVAVFAVFLHQLCQSGAFSHTNYQINSGDAGDFTGGGLRIATGDHHYRTGLYGGCPTDALPRLSLTQISDCASINDVNISHCFKRDNFMAPFPKERCHALRIILIHLAT
jgi:hypothetical protein